MLVLTRKPTEEILIDGRIKVSIVKVQGQKVRIGIEAPEEVSVQRREVAERIRQEERQDEAPRDRRLRSVHCG